MTHTTHAGNFEAAVAAADLDAEIAVYTADTTRPDFIYYSCVANGFVFGNATTVYQTYTAADIARSAPIPTPTPMPGPGDFDENDSGFCVTCNCPAGGFFHDMLATTWVDLRHAFVSAVDTADTNDSTLCANCCQPADDRCYECRIDLCAGCNERWHRHGQPASPRRNGTAFFDRQRAAAAFRKSTIETYLFNARAAATELHGDIGDAAYSERVQRGVDELFN